MKTLDTSTYDCFRRVRRSTEYRVDPLPFGYVNIRIYDPISGLMREHIHWFISNQIDEES